MSIIILGDLFHFPDGNAATNRVYTYAQGFSERGISVHIISFSNLYTSDISGEIGGIKYYHPFNQECRNKYFLVRRLQKFKKYYNTLRLIKTINKNDKLVAINVWTYSLLVVMFAYAMRNLTRSKLILEISENPLKNYQSNKFKKGIGLFNIWFQLFFCDGVFCISNFLFNYLRSINNSSNLIIIPSTVDEERFAVSNSHSPFSFRYIAYCGSISLTENNINKDGVDILIKAFSRIAAKFSDINLVIVGKATSVKDKLIVEELIGDLGLKSRVVLTGRVNREKVPAYLLNAELLALARPSSIVAEAGFPSKLTEYLATGNPVVVTKVGDIPVYLNDFEHAFLVQPDDVNAFAEKIEYVLNNPSLAKIVGKKGKTLTLKTFSYHYQSKRMIEFIDLLYRM